MLAPSKVKPRFQLAALRAGGRELVRFEPRLLIALWTIDALLIACHIMLGATQDKIPQFFNISLDWSLAEFVDYILFGASAALLFLIYRRTRIAIYLSMAVVLFVMLLDDALQIHERFALPTASMTDFQANPWVQVQEFGELAVWGLLGLMLLPVLAFGVVKSRIAHLLAVAPLCACIGVLMIFAIGVDFLHQGVCHASGGFPYCVQILDLIEDGGEMLTQAFIFAHIVALYIGVRLP